MTSTQMLYASIREGMTTSRTDYGEAAGEAVMGLAETRGLSDEVDNVYDLAVATAVISDLVCTAVRKPESEPWTIPDKIGDWVSSAFLSPDGHTLRRVVLVSHWSDERHYSEIRSWWAIGEVCHYKMPMEQVVIVLGHNRTGRRHGAWTKCYQHPMNGVIRFRKKSRSTSEIFKDSWREIWRVDHAEISNQTWLNAMLRDDVLPEVCFKVDIPVPSDAHCQKIRDMASRKLDRLYALKERPEANLSTCDFPVKCQFLRLCHTLPERLPSEKNGFMSIHSREFAVKP